MAHCASRGEVRDLDDPKAPMKLCFDLFIRYAGVCLSLAFSISLCVFSFIFLSISLCVDFSLSLSIYISHIHRMMDEDKYKNLLFADISGLTSFKRIGVPLQVCSLFLLSLYLFLFLFLFLFFSSIYLFNSISL